MKNGILFSIIPEIRPILAKKQGGISHLSPILVGKSLSISHVCLSKIEHRIPNPCVAWGAIFSEVRH